MVVPYVIGPISKFKILQPIVIAYFVFMVDVLTTSEPASDMRFHDKIMFQTVLSVPNPHRDVAIASLETVASR